jgi:hypothetical protein
LATTKDASGFLNEDAISNFQDFVQEYIDVFAAAGYDYQDVVSGVVGDLSDLQIDVQTESAKLTEAIKANTNALEGNDGVINAITNLANITQQIANKESYKAWKEAAPELSSIQGNTAGFDMTGARLNTGPVGAKEISQLSELATALDTENNRAETIKNWASSLGEGASENVKKWIQDMPVYNPISSFRQIDLDSSGVMSQQELSSVLSVQDAEYKKLLDWFANIPAYAKGGYATTPSIAGEAGPEWVVPAYNNPNNQNFLKSVGMDSGVIGSQIGVIVADKVSKAIYNALSNMTLNSDNQGDIVVKINEKEIARATLSQMKNNPSEFRKVLQ